MAFALVVAAKAQPPTEAPTPSSGEGERPRIGLVLSGGGARGAAHVGVLEVLEELRVPVDVIVGTSMGAIVGGLYAAGMSPAELRATITETDWPALFQDRPDRAKRYFRRKEDDIDFPVRYKVYIRDGKLALPLGVLQAQRLGNRLDRYEQMLGAATAFDELPIPFRAVAGDLETGTAVVIRDGSLARSMRASMSIPGVFRPVEIDGRLLVDGGIVANLPVGIMQSEFDVDVILAVDISTPLGEADFESYLTVVRQLVRLMTYSNVQQDIARIGPQDFLLTPDLGDITTADFARSAEAVDIGRNAALAASERLSRWSVSEAEYARLVTRQRRASRQPPVVTAIEVAESGPIRSEIVEGFLTQALGEPFDADGIEEDLVRLNGLGLHDAISYSLVEGGPNGGATLRITAPEKSTGRTTVQFGLEIEDDFEGGNNFALASRLQKLAINRRGAEWRTTLRIGDNGGLDTEFYQPLDNRLRFFGSVRALYERDEEPVFVDGHAEALVRATVYGGGFDFGRNLGTWGQVRAGVVRGVVDAGIEIGPEEEEPPQLDLARFDLELRFDTVDDVNWPSRGAFGNIAWRREVDELGGDTDGGTLRTNLDGAFPLGRFRILPGAEASVVVNDEEGFDTGTTLGGLFRLSGYPPFELIGRESVLGRVVAYRRMNRRVIPKLPAGLYVGLSIEAGNVFQLDESIDAGELLYGGTAFLGADTPIGPLILGFGWAEPDRSRVYLSFGRSFF